ncbi:MAG: sigma-70 family RNA polymerase sigma factor [Planctomycetota bacterium]
MSHPKNTEESFQHLMDGVRANDEESTRRLVECYEPQIRRTVRMRLLNSRLRTWIDSTDVTQSVLGRFFARFANGKLDCSSASSLRALLLTMTRNRVRDWVRRQRTATRDICRQVPFEEANQYTPRSDNQQPDRQCEDREILELAYQSLQPVERAMALARANGESWQSIAKQHGKSKEAVRMQYSRAIRTLRKDLFESH